MTTTPKKSDPLTHEEVTEAADIFFPLFNEVHSHRLMALRLKILSRLWNL